MGTNMTRQSGANPSRALTGLCSFFVVQLIVAASRCRIIIKLATGATTSRCWATYWARRKGNTTHYVNG